MKSKTELDRREFLARLAKGSTVAAAGIGLSGISGCRYVDQAGGLYHIWKEMQVWPEKIEPKNYGISLDSLNKPSEPLWPVSFPAPIFQVKDFPKPKGVTAPDFQHPGLEMLLEKMWNHGFPFYRTQTRGHLAGPDGLIARHDTVVIKINVISMFECGINTDVLRGLIRRILDHPEGFKGEVVLVDWCQVHGPANSLDPENTVQVVADSFYPAKVSYYQFSYLTHFTVLENQMADGFVRLEDEHPDETEYDRLSYPKFTTRFGTHIDLKHGLWTGSGYDDSRFRFINFSILKDHHLYGSSNTLKNLLGCLDIGTFNLPGSVYKFLRTHTVIFSEGLLGRFMNHVRRPDLNLSDAIRIIHQHPFGPVGVTPITDRSLVTSQTNSLLASIEPVTLEYYAVKNILYPLKCITPCKGLIATEYCCIKDPPCKNGICERHDPDSELETAFESEERWQKILPFEPETFNMKWIPFNSLNQIIHTSSMALYGRDVRNEYVIF